MTRTIEFDCTISRTRPFDHDVEVHVKAVLRRVRGEPGSLSIQDGWEIDECSAIDADGGEVDDESAQQQIEEAAMEIIEL